MSDLKNQNILFLCSWYPSRTNPFNGNFIFKHARSLVKKGIPIKVLSVYEDLSISGRFELEKGEEEGVEHLIIYYSYPFKWLKFFYKARAFFKGIRYWEQKLGKLDLIHVHVLIDAGFIAWWVHFWKKIPYLITEHSTVYLPTDPFKYPKSLKSWMKRVIRNSSYILPVSNDLAANMKRVFSKTPYQVIPNVVNTSLFLPPQKRTPQSLRFLHISNFTLQKNIAGLLRGFKKLSDQRKDFSITLAGDGDLEEVKRIAQKINLPLELINFRGKMTELEVAEIFHLHDVFVLFSDYENLPCVLVEAQVCGMPIIATDVGGVSEIVNSKAFGLVIPARDEIDLTESLHYMIDCFSDYDTQKIRTMAIQKYSEDAVAEAMMEVYQKILILS